MNEIEDLIARLTQINGNTLSFWDAPEIARMEKIASELSLKVRRRGGTNSNSYGHERTLRAIRNFRIHNSDADQRSLRLAAYGCCLRIEEDQYALVADKKTLEALLSTAKTYRSNPRFFRRLYNGFLSAYFTADRYADWFSDDVGAAFEFLRQFLFEMRADASKVQPQTSSIEILEQYPDLLGNHPGSYLANKWVSGDQEELGNVTAKLNITGNSWLAVETVRAALADAIKKTDSKFIGDIPRLLAASAEPRFRVIRDQIYEDILSRYATMQAPLVHAQLRDAVVAAWKNPWLPSNDAAWGRVSDKARRMVTGWLKLEFIHQFFEVLSDEGEQDYRRFKFWRDYYEQIDDVYFALGSDAYRSTRPDLKKLRADLDGRLLELIGPPKTNAFIMCMGDRVIVEFSQTSNAVHTFSISKLAIDSSSKAKNISRLKIANGPDRWIHRGDWEDDFRRRLGNRAAPRNAASVSQRDATTNLIRPATAQTTNREDDIILFAKAQSIRVDDRRPRGGNLWLLYDGYEPDVIANLKIWGFSHSPNKGWWRPQ